MVQFGKGPQIGGVLAALEQVSDTGLQLIRQRPHTLHTLLKVDVSHLPGKFPQIEGTFEYKKDPDMVRYRSMPGSFL